MATFFGIYEGFGRVSTVMVPRHSLYKLFYNIPKPYPDVYIQAALSLAGVRSDCVVNRDTNLQAMHRKHGSHGGLPKIGDPK